MWQRASAAVNAAVGVGGDAELVSVAEGVGGDAAAGIGVSGLWR